MWPLFWPIFKYQGLFCHFFCHFKWHFCMAGVDFSKFFWNVLYVWTCLKKVNEISFNDVFVWMCFLQKRQLASQSLAFNIKDKVFCELFPDVVEVSIVPVFLTDVFMSSKHILSTNVLMLGPVRPPSNRKSSRSSVCRKSSDLAHRRCPFPMWCRMAKPTTRKTGTCPWTGTCPQVRPTRPTSSRSTVTMDSWVERSLICSSL